MNTIKLKDIKLVNWNANGIKNKKSTIIEFLLSDVVAVILKNLKCYCNDLEFTVRLRRQASTKLEITIS